VNFSDFKITEKIYESEISIVYRAVTLNDLTPVILKTLNRDYPTQLELSQFRREYDVSQELKGIEQVWQTESLLQIHNTLVIVGNDIDGISLKKWLKLNTNINIKKRLEIAIALANALKSLHLNHLIHKDITPDNVIFNEDTNKIQIIDFGIASLLDNEFHNFQNVNQLEGTLSYISPEQTGRVNRNLDYRSDLYSYGIVLYELFSGLLPFNEQQELALVHAHISKQAINVREINNNIPKALSKIIMKLLSKSADGRYQSCEGLIYDLDACFYELTLNNSDFDFEIAKKDSLQVFNIPQKLYGRQKQIKAILNSFFNICSSKAEVLFILGPSGTGKTALVQEIYKPLTSTSGFFISGKFEQFQKNIPFYAWSQALNELVQLLLKEKKEVLDYWKDIILEAVGDLGQVITQVVPSLELIIGVQPDVSELTNTQAHNRFNYVFINFLTSLATKKFPLIIFIDDWQWADNASLSLLKRVSDEMQDTSLLLINAYRDDEVDDAHSLSLVRSHITSSTINNQDIQLNNLTYQDVHDLISEMLNNPIGIDDLVKLVFNKTAGNAFFLMQFLDTLKEKKLILFDVKNTSWYWHHDELHKENMTSNVIELLSQKFITLPIETQHALKFASSINNRFSLKMLASVIGKPQNIIAQALEPALLEGILRPLDINYRYATQKVIYQDVNYRFAHDNLQKAAYALLPEDLRTKTHLQIALTLESKLSEQDKQKELFNIVNHYNIASDLIVTDPSIHNLINLNIEAGKKAMSSTAFSSALNYFENAIELLPKEPWKELPDICSELLMLSAETALLEKQYAKMESWIDELLAHTRLPIEQASIWTLRLQAYTAQNRLEEAVETAYIALAFLDINLSKKPSSANVMYELFKTKYKLRNQTNKSLLELEKMTDPSNLLIMRILGLTIPPAYWTSQNLVAVIVFKMTQISIVQGYSPMTGYAFSWWGITESALLNNIKSGTQFGKLGIEIAEKYDIQLQQPIFFMGWMIQNFEKPLIDSIQTLEQAYEVSLEKGDHEYASYALNNLTQAKFNSANSLDELIQSMESTHKTLKSFGYASSQYWHDICWQTAINLHETCNNPDVLNGNAYNENEKLQLHESAKDHSTLFLFYFNKLLLSVFFNKASAIAYANKGREYLKAGAGMYAFATFHFYDSIALLRDTKRFPENKRSNLKRIKQNQKKLKHWAEHSPLNYLNKWQLIEAEYCSFVGKTQKAMTLYADAISSSEKAKLHHEQALAHELTAKFYLSLNQVRLAITDIKQAYYLYRNWDAHHKATDVEKEFTSILPNLSQPDLNAQLNLTQRTQSCDGLDLTSLIKSSQMMTKEIELESLTKTLLKIIMENAGADRGFLFLLQENETLSLQAFGWVESLALNISSIQETDEQILKSMLPVSIINYVTRTQTDLVIENATQDKIFSNDPYFESHAVYSCFCHCIMHQGKQVGLIYLENSLLQGAFSNNKIEMIELLSSQAAISIVNSHFFSQLERKVLSRTKELQTSLEKQELLNHELLKSNKKLDDTHNKLQQANLKLLKLANTDGLTNLANRRQFNQRIEDEFNRGRRLAQPLTLLFCDIDNFKSFNDTFGHVEGDEVLKQVARAMESLFVRSSDLTARYGGEEFSIILPDIDKKQAHFIAQRLNQVIAELDITHSGNLPHNKITLSIGSYTLVPTAETNVKMLLEGADKAVYAAKHNGRHCHIDFESLESDTTAKLIY